jgi:hypothetical protein
VDCHDGLDLGRVPPEHPAEPFLSTCPAIAHAGKKNGASCGAPFVWLSHAHQDT